MFDAVKHLLPNSRGFAVVAIFIVASTACKIGGFFMGIAHQRSIWDAIAIYIKIASPFFGKVLQILLPKHFAAIDGLVRVLKPLRHPQIHTQIKIAQ